MKHYHRITLTNEERAELTSLVGKGKGVARRITHARILLLADEKQAGGAWKDAEIAKALGVHVRTVERTRCLGIYSLQVSRDGDQGRGWPL